VKSLTANIRRLVAATAVSLLLANTGWAGPKYQVLYAFRGGNDGAGLSGGLTFDKDNNLYGATSGGGDYGYGTVFQLTPHADGSWTETILRSFKNGDPNGSEPNGGFIFDATGNLYGTAADGGNSYCSYGCGVVFQMAPGNPGNWAENVLFSFDFNDGAHPTAGVIMDNEGNLYGTADVAFELAANANGWKEIVLHRFTGKHGDGLPPVSGLISDGSGNLYGTTVDGGNYPPDCRVSGGCGIVFELLPRGHRWREQVVHRFSGFSDDGSEPSSGVVLDAAGDLYGTTTIGGGTGCTAGCGVVYKLTRGTNGRWKESLLHTFGNGQNGSYPDGGVVIDKKGNLYGTTAYGGSSCGCGLIYKLTPAPKGKWKYTVLHTFYGWDGAVPAGGLVMDDKGNLYGGTALGGTYGFGVVFELTP